MLADGVQIRNKGLDSMEVDTLYHIGFSTNQSLKEMFGDVRFVCMGGTAYRMEKLARNIVRDFGIKLPTGTDLCDLSMHSHRYSMFKAGPVLCVGHGMGAPSVSILLHELFKLLYYAEAKDVIFIRMGTSGGLGLPPGSIVVSKKVINEFGETSHPFAVLGRRIDRPCVLPQDLADEIINVGRAVCPDVTVVGATTMSANDFYEGQARLDGAFCDYTAACKQAFLSELHSERGVTNIEMESSVFSAMCHHAGIKAAVVCVTIVERLQEDQITCRAISLDEAQMRLQSIVMAFIKEKLHWGL
ncbi:uridine phosphorylase 1-like [Galendromus occidentalis]|uniref:Uridine phosphorylase n=1 Tax=Galendromus occidentalis TaxID=34638 RepID=A0AAJ7WI96_9ACAR|nr:uridine phosphorylase 1-like [Galendromus occidentalis]